MILKLFVDDTDTNNRNTNNISTLKRKYLDESMRDNLKLFNMIIQTTFLYNLLALPLYYIF